MTKPVFEVQEFRNNRSTDAFTIFVHDFEGGGDEDGWKDNSIVISVQLSLGLEPVRFIAYRGEDVYSNYQQENLTFMRKFTIALNKAMEVFEAKQFGEENDRQEN